MEDFQNQLLRERLKKFAALAGSGAGGGRDLGRWGSAAPEVTKPGMAPTATAIQESTYEVPASGGGSSGGGGIGLPIPIPLPGISGGQEGGMGLPGLGGMGLPGMGGGDLPGMERDENGDVDWGDTFQHGATSFANFLGPLEVNDDGGSFDTQDWIKTIGNALFFYFTGGFSGMAGAGSWDDYARMGANLYQSDQVYDSEDDDDDNNWMNIIINALGSYGGTGR